VARQAPLAEMGHRAQMGFEARYERSTATGAIAAVLREAAAEGAVMKADLIVSR